MRMLPDFSGSGSIIMFLSVPTTYIRCTHTSMRYIFSLSSASSYFFFLSSKHFVNSLTIDWQQVRAGHVTRYLCPQSTVILLTEPVDRF